MLLAVLRRSHAIILLEDGSEMARIVEAHRVSHLIDIDTTLGDDSGSLLQAKVSDKLSGGDAGHLLHLAVQVRSADTHFLT